MARFTVHMTFEAARLHEPMVRRVRVGRGSYMTCIGADGQFSVSAVVRADSPADAASLVVRRTHDLWSTQRYGGPIHLVAWTAHRQRVLVGARGGVSSSATSGLPEWNGGDWPDDDGPDDGGLAGVREPRRPSPPPGTLSAARPVPGRPEDLPEDR